MKKLSLILCFLIVSCTKLGFFKSSATKSPDEVVRGFIEMSAKARNPQDKQKLEELCSGEMRRVFNRMTDEMFKTSYLASGISLKDVKILETQIESQTARVRYQVSLENTGGTDSTRETNEREVDLTLARGQWYIDSIRISGTDRIAFSRGMVF
jgi:hypothetical protein